MPAKTLMVLGTSSSVGKSLLVTALCRIFARRGLRVAPFKAQNMSNNAAVCSDGAEIGRAQALQAAAARIAPTADMNPILLKPEADSRAHVIVAGRHWRTLAAREYYECKHELWPTVTAALDRLRAHFDLVLIEGAGSPAELNLRDGDIVNMAVARYAGSPVLLAGDVDRGGIFAQLLGTLWLLDADERHLVRGLVVNKFRGDPALFSDGVRILEERAAVPVLGVIPYLHDLVLPEEDSMALPCAERAPRQGALDIVVIRLPHIANFEDFDPLRQEPGVDVRYATNRGSLGRPKAIILPGSKNTLADLAWLRARGLDQDIVRLAEKGTAVVGICGGYQMLGGSIRDSYHLESSAGAAEGLGLLPIETVFEPTKATYQARGRISSAAGGWLATLVGDEIEGYEIHLGRTRGGRPWLTIDNRNGAAVCEPDGAASPDGRIWGCYLHGIFANTTFRHAWLASLGLAVHAETASSLEASLDHLADAFAAALDIERITGIIDSAVLPSTGGS